MFGTSLKTSLLVKRLKQVTVKVEKKKLPLQHHEPLWTTRLDKSSLIMLDSTKKIVLKKWFASVNDCSLVLSGGASRSPRLFLLHQDSTSLSSPDHAVAASPRPASPNRGCQTFLWSKFSVLFLSFHVVYRLRPAVCLPPLRLHCGCELLK